MAMREGETVSDMTIPPGFKPLTHMTLDEALMLAVAMHRANGLDDAEKIYQRILEAAPDHADALHFMGVLQHQRGRSAQAIDSIRRSIAENGAVADWHSNLGNVLLETGQVDAAAHAYEQALLLAPERADIHNNLGVLLRRQQRDDEAEAAYRRAIAIDPANADAHTNLGRLLNAQGRNEEALAIFCEALVLDPKHVKARHALGMAYQILGRIEQAVQVYRDWLADEPGNPEALHHLAACTGVGVPDRAPDDYVQKVFDGFANSFDAKLAQLDYRAPELIAQAVAPLAGEPRRALVVLDAGCGTGLCGPLLAPYARRLDGVDLSPQMLAKARLRQVYDELACAELTAFIEGAAPASYDLIVSADTLCYFGDLRAVARAAARALARGGWLVFTVETATSAGDAGFRLNPHGRYSHREAYLREVLAAAGLEIGGFEPVQLRTENVKPVEGWVVSCRTAGARSSSP